MCKDEIIVGIDFGTTYSGVSWALNSGAREVRLIKNWPGPDTNPTRTSEKIPSLISSEASEFSWGFRVDPESHQRWFKLLLNPGVDHAQGLKEIGIREEQICGKTDRSPQEPAAKYLENLWLFIKKQVPALDWIGTDGIKIILTVPATWKEVARNNTLLAAKQAGIPKNITLVSEPEAAALSVFRDVINGGITLQKGDVFTVCDAGGGTIDLISYKVVQSDPLELEEFVPGTGDTCGAIFIVREFEEHLMSEIGEDEVSKLDGNYRAALLDFEENVLRDFNGEEVQHSVKLKGVRGDNFPISGSTLRSMFDPVCNKVIALVEDQINAVEKKGDKVKKVILVGGFGANEYLYQNMVEAIEARDSEIGVVRPSLPWSAVCRGATLWGIEHSERQVRRGIPSTVSSRLARRSYGIRADVPFEWSKHWNQVPVKDETGAEIIKDRMIWLIEKGDRIKQGHRCEREITEHVPVGWLHLLTQTKHSFEHTLWYSEEDYPPNQFKDNEVTKLCTVKHSVRKGGLVRRSMFRRNRKNQREVSFTLAIEMGSADMDFFIIYNDGEVGRCKAEFE